MAACETKSDMISRIEKNLIIQLKRDNPTLKGVDIRKMAKEAANDIAAKVTTNVEASNNKPKPSPAVLENAPNTPQPLEKDRPKFIVPKHIIDLKNAYHADYSNKTAEELHNAETAAGMRNKLGELIVNPVYPTYGSKAKPKLGDPLTDSEIEDLYTDIDGDMTKSEQVMDALGQLDEANGVKTVWSKHLGKIRQSITHAVSAMNKLNINMTQDKFNEMTVAQGVVILPSGEIEIKVDNHGVGQDFRNRFSMTNQEVYVHELTHAALGSAFDVDVGKDPVVADLVNELRKVYAAAQDTTWQDLLPGYKDGTQYYDPNGMEVEEAKQKWSYIFSPKGRNEAKAEGEMLHEFAAHLLTNEQFATAMSDIYLSRSKRKDAINIVDELIHNFRNFIAKLVGFSVTKEGNLTDVGTDLIFNLMAANSKATDKAIANHTVSIAEKTAEYIGEKFDTMDKRLSKPVTKIIDKLTGDVKKEGETDATKSERVDKILANRAKTVKKQKARNENAQSKAGRAYAKTLNFYEDIRDIPGLLQLKKDSAEVAKVYESVMTSMNLYQDGMLRSITDDFLEKDGLYNTITDAILHLTTQVDSMREKTYEDVLSDTKEWFGDVPINTGVNMDKAANEALTSVVLRSDIQSIVSSTKELRELLMKSDKELQTEINSIAKTLTPAQVSDAKSLATYMATGVGLITNADNIARGFGRGKVKDFANADTVAAIDRLASLEAFRQAPIEERAALRAYMSPVSVIGNGTSTDPVNGYAEYKANVEATIGMKISKLIPAVVKDKLKKEGVTLLTEAEYSAQIDSGIQSFINYSRGMQQASREEMGSEPHSIIKGYMKETLDNASELKFVDASRRKEFEDDGYVFQRDVVEKMPGSPRKMIIMTSKYGIKAKRANGALGLQGTQSRGFTLYDSLLEDNNEKSASEILDPTQLKNKFSMILAATEAEYEANPEKVGMHPVYNAKGEVVNFRKTLSNTDKKQYMGMESKGTVNLSRSYGTMSTVKKTDAHNADILHKLKADYDANYKGNEHLYVKITVPDVVTAESYGMEEGPQAKSILAVTDDAALFARLPKGTKEAAKAIFGEKEMIVRKDLVKPLFGYDELSLADANFANKLSTKTRGRIRMFEKYWQDTMQIAKSNIVIKTTEVFIGNITSNAKILGYIGVNPVKGTKLMLLGAKELERYESDKRALKKLEREDLALKKTESLTDTVTREKAIKVLEAKIENNTVTKLVEEFGMFQSIVEDVSLKDDNNKVSQYVNSLRDEKLAGKLKPLNTAIQYMYLTEKTGPFQQMLKATQVSDFYFRYAQYYDAINNKGHSEARAKREVIDNYINYEAPLNSFIKYGDRMGPFFFITYFTRIQRVVKRMVKNNPARIATDITQQFIFGDQDDILDQSFVDASIWNKYNPFKIFGHLWQVVSPSGVELVAKAL